MISPLKQQQIECEEKGHIWEPVVFSWANIYACELGCGAEKGDGLTRVDKEKELWPTDRRYLGTD